MFVGVYYNELKNSVHLIGDTSMEKELNSFSRGLRDGIPICLGYLSVAFAFGIFTVGHGLTIWEAVMISMTNESAGTIR